MLKIILVPSLHRVSGTPARQNPLFPPLPKGGRKGDFFATFASLRLCSGHALRETFRASVAAVPRWVLRVSAVNSILFSCCEIARQYHLRHQIAPLRLRW